MYRRTKGASVQQFLRQLTGRERTRRADRQLGGVLAFVAGAVNAGGFLAVHQYTSHMTGIVSAIADELVVGQARAAAAGALVVAAFVAGATTTALLSAWARRRQMHSEYALSLLVEALLLLVFGLLGVNLDRSELLVPVTVLLLSFLMGLQNAIITRLSQATIRTTHMTGILTDLGIELGRLVYWNRNKTIDPAEHVRADRDKLGLFAMILGLFVVGGVVGAAGFKALGFAAAVPLAGVLLLMAILPVLDDLAVVATRRRASSAKQPPADD